MPTFDNWNQAKRAIPQLAAKERDARLAPRGSHPKAPALRQIMAPADDWCIEVEMSWPPSVNAMYTTATNGRRVLTKAARRWKRDAVKQIQAQLSGVSRAELPVSVTVTFSMWQLHFDHSNKDLDNRLKAAQDALEDAGIIVNDEQIAELHIHRRTIDTDAWPTIRICVELWQGETP